MYPSNRKIVRSKYTEICRDSSNHFPNADRDILIQGGQKTKRAEDSAGRRQISSG